MQKRKWLRTRYAVYKNTLHMVFAVKYRKKILTTKVLLLLEEVFRSTCKRLECFLLEFGGESDHVHLLVDVSTKMPIYKLVGELKGASSYRVRKNFTMEIKKRLWVKHLWSPSYCVVSCGGASIDVVKSYVQNQGRA